MSAIRARLAGEHGPRYWRSLDEVAQTPEFRALVEAEFPAGALDWADAPSRRRFLQLMAASLALAGLTGCQRQPREEIVPYVQQPEYAVPGVPLYYATADVLGGLARGTLVTSHLGRPTKVDGNALHPASPGPYQQAAVPSPVGALDAFAQAAVLGLYDPDRAQSVRHLGRFGDWARFLLDVDRELRKLRARRGAGLAILTETVSSPTLAAQLAALLEQCPEAKWHQYEPLNRDLARQGALLAFGQDVQPRYHFDQAAVILALDADFLGAHPLAMRYAHDFVARRRVRQGMQAMNRLYVAESAFTPTGAKADHRLALPPREIERFAVALAQAVGVQMNLPARDGQHGQTSADSSLPVAPASGFGAWLDAVRRDLTEHRGACLVVAGAHQSPAVQAVAHALNHVLGGIGKTVTYTAPVEARAVDQTQSLRELTGDMAAGKTQVLVVLGTNPVYHAPADLEFAAHYAKVPLRIHLGLYEDETGRQSHWHIPQAHPLESWSDARAFDGTVSIVQPLIAPLYPACRTAHELLAVLTGVPNRTSHEIVQGYWRQHWPDAATRSAPGTPGGPGFEAAWRRTLHDGVMPGTALPTLEPRLQTPLEIALTEAPVAGELEICFRPDPSVWDGRFANNGWLQELPRPMTKLTWDNAVLLSPRTAERYGLARHDVVRLELAGRRIEGPVWILPGHADGCVTLHLGYGRTAAGHVGEGVGFDVYALRRSEHPWNDRGLTLHQTGRTHELVSTQWFQTMHGRDLVRGGDLQQFRADPRALVADSAEGAAGGAQEKPAIPLSLYEPIGLTAPNQWGMSIDLTACIGCNACVVACIAENNIAVVGKPQVARGRYMHWLRIDTYYAGGLDQPHADFQPVLCMHCENAPCETVCPVGATQHSADGLNEMIYNRCLGTRYCSNNCPYKVRRFNFLTYSDYTHPTIAMQKNPQVTVRQRGVMEKCTYCVQRIQAAKIAAQEQGNRPIRDGEVVTACQAACPTEAIVFGNLADRASKVAALKQQPHDYGLLTELNTRPRTTYLARVRNPSEQLKEETQPASNSKLETRNSKPGAL